MDASGHLETKRAILFAHYFQLRRGKREKTVFLRGENAVIVTVIHYAVRKVEHPFVYIRMCPASESVLFESDFPFEGKDTFIILCRTMEKEDLDTLPFRVDDPISLHVSGWIHDGEPVGDTVT